MMHSLVFQMFAGLRSAPPDPATSFSIIEPPSLPKDPLYPNRLEFAAAGGGAGVALAFLFALFHRWRHSIAPQPMAME